MAAELDKAPFGTVWPALPLDDAINSIHFRGIDQAAAAPRPDAMIADDQHFYAGNARKR